MQSRIPFRINTLKVFQAALQDTHTIYTFFNHCQITQQIQYFPCFELRLCQIQTLEYIESQILLHLKIHKNYGDVNYFNE